MKKILFFLLLSFYSYAQNKCYCDLVENAGPLAKMVKDQEGEFLAVVGEGQELWVKMNPAAKKNTLENGGCRLKPGEKFVAKNDVNGTLLPIRAWKCGNVIENYSFHQTGTVLQTTSNFVLADSVTRVEGLNNRTVIVGNSGVGIGVRNNTLQPQTVVVRNAYKNSVNQTKSSSMGVETGVFGFNQNTQPTYLGNPQPSQVLQRQGIYEQQTQLTSPYTRYVVQEPAQRAVYQNPNLVFVQKTKTNRMKWWHYGLAIVGGVVIGDLVTGGGLDFYGCFQKTGTNPGYIPGNTPKTPIDDRPPNGFVIPIGF
jgi:hypothetical protein